MKTRRRNPDRTNQLPLPGGWRLEGAYLGLIAMLKPKYAAMFAMPYIENELVFAREEGTGLPSLDDAFGSMADNVHDMGDDMIVDLIGEVLDYAADNEETLFSEVDDRELTPQVLEELGLPRDLADTL